jgi:hypothetical protein
MLEDSRNISGHAGDLLISIFRKDKVTFAVYSMIGPSFCEATVTPAMQRIHHSISWNNAVPKILDDTHKKQ